MIFKLNNFLLIKKYKLFNKIINYVHKINYNKI